MFLKLLKWDLKSQRNIFVLFFIYLLSVANVGLTKLIDLDWLIGIAMALHVVLAVLLVAIPLILLAVNYYGDFYGKNAYTMHQLAVKTATILNAKLLSGAIYLVMSVLLLIFGSLVMGTIFNGYAAMGDFIRDIAKSFSLLVEIPNHIENLNAFGFWSIIIVSTVFALFSSQIFYAFVITLGNSGWLRQLGKGGMVLSFLITYIGTQVISFLTIMFVPLTIAISISNGSMLRLDLKWVSFFETMNGYLLPMEGAIPLGSMLVTMIISILCYVYVVQALNHKKSIS